ncbi:hypothetical protein ACFQJC_14385 [Haloferax namakaokahaiae]|uniref:Uncharacterized protein n=1 Tax=Haloferax namakaokahaiae TaxID=1748331 RepID=A0ABD5ZHN3_9EURY
MAEVDRDLITQIVQHRSDIYDRLASDSLSILSIQLFVIPLTISLISLVSRVVSNMEGEASESITTLATALDTQNTGFAVIGMLFSISLTSITYYLARRKASNQFIYLSQWENRNKGSDSSTWVFERYRRIFDNHVETRTDYSDITDQFKQGSKPGEVLRAALGTSLFVTLASLAVIFNQVTSAISNEITSILVVLGFSTFLILIYSQTLVSLVLIAEEIVGVNSRFVQTVFSYLVFSEDSLVMNNPFRNLSILSLFLFLTLPYLEDPNPVEWAFLISTCYFIFAAGIYYQAKLEVKNRNTE